MNNTTDRFIFDHYSFNLFQGEAFFFYKIMKDDKEIVFQEKLTFPPTSDSIPEELLNKVLDNIHLVLGISYWKLYCPKNIETPTIQLSQSEAQFWNTIYTKGLGEFYYKNKIYFQNLVYFPFVEAVTSISYPFERKNRSLVGIGGGKDSIVAAELLKRAGKNFSGFILNSRPLQENVANLLGIETISMKREIDPQLIELNKQENTYNGHVPISTIYAFIALFAALLYDYRYIIVSNEKSANYGNLEYLGEVINHQWSKSEEFEKLFQEYVKNTIISNVTYFSLLRPFYELKITEFFSHYPQYFSSFSSCNRNFRLNQNDKGPLWCGECAKCAFVFLLLASVLSKDKAIEIFGQNLLEKEKLLPMYRQLLGIEDIKPFDCVGTPEEVKLAFHMVSEKHELDDSAAVKMFKIEVKDIDFEKLRSEALSVSTLEIIPEEFRGIF